MAESIIIYRKDGTPVDVSAYVDSMEINRGDVTGFGEAGCEGIAHTLTLNLNNTKEINFSPFSEKGVNVSEFQTITGNNSKVYPANVTNIYAATVMTDTQDLTVWLSENNFVFSRILKTGEIARVMYTRYDLTVANPINTYLGSFNPLLDEMAAIEVFSNQNTIQSKKTTLTGNGTNIYTVSDKIIAETLMTVDGTGAVFNPNTQEITLNRKLKNGETLEIMYSYQEGVRTCIFSGYIGNSINISEDNSQIQLICSDKVYRLQKAYIDQVEYNKVREYAVEKVFAEELIQNTLDDIFGVGQITLYTPVPSGQLIEITSNDWGGKTVWDMFQGIASAIGWVLSYEYNSSTGNFELTFRSVPRNKTTADYTIDYNNDLLALPVTISGTEIYNSLLLYYKNSTSGKVEYVKAENTASVNSYGRRVGIIKESQTLGINNSTQAQLLANNIVADISEKVVQGTITIPLNLKYKFFDIVAINYPRLSNYQEPFVIESIQHSFNYVTQEFKTTLGGNKQKVRGGTLRWTNKITRPGKLEQITNRDIGAVTLLKKPSDLQIIESGIEKLSLTSKAYAVLQWNRPLGEYPAKYELQIKKSTDNWEKSEKYSIISSEVAGVEQIRQKVTLETNTTYVFRVYAVDTNGKKGVVSDEKIINGIGDNIPPAVVTGMTVTAGVKQAIVSFDPNTTDTDFLKYRIYYKKGSQPTINDTVFKETTSTKTTIDNLDTDGAYYFRALAIDTSGNKSELNAAISVTPKLVDDDIFAEIRDKTLHIKTNAQMQQWIDSLNDVTSDTITYTDVSNNYNIVKIYNTVTDFTINRGIAILCSDLFTIEGIGKPIIKVNFSNAYNRIVIKSRGFNCKKIKFLNYTTVSGWRRSLFALVNYDTSKNKAIFEETDGEDATGSYTVLVSGSYSLDVKSGYFKNFRINTFEGDFLQNNIFESVNITGINNPLTAVVTIKNVKILGNVFKNTKISSSTSSYETAEYITINDNTFDFTFENTDGGTAVCVEALPLGLLNIQLSTNNNKIRVRNIAGTSPKSIRFIDALSRDYIFSQICNNSFYSENPSLVTLSTFLNCTGSTTGTIIANNTNN